MEDELNIVRINQDGGEDSETGRRGQAVNGMEVVLGPDRIAALRARAARVHVDEQIERYIVSIVAATRPARDRTASPGAARKPFYTGAEASIRTQAEGIYRYISFGASPRASIALHRCAKIRALFGGNTFVRPEDVKAAAPAVLRHRLSLSYEAEADGLDTDAVIARILASVPAP